MQGDVVLAKTLQSNYLLECSLGFRVVVHRFLVKFARFAEVLLRLIRIPQSGSGLCPDTYAADCWSKLVRLGKVWNSFIGHGEVEIIFANRCERPRFVTRGVDVVVDFSPFVEVMDLQISRIA